MQIAGKLHDEGSHHVIFLQVWLIVGKRKRREYHEENQQHPEQVRLHPFCFE